MSAISDAVNKNPGRSNTGQGAIQALWRGTVSEVRGTSIWCTVPHLAGVHQLGPMPTAVPGLTVGARVIVAAIEGRKDDLMILAAA